MSVARATSVLTMPVPLPNAPAKRLPYAPNGRKRSSRLRDDARDDDDHGGDAERETSREAGSRRPARSASSASARGHEKADLLSLRFLGRKTPTPCAEHTSTRSARSSTSSSSAETRGPTASSRRAMTACG